MKIINNFIINILDFLISKDLKTAFIYTGLSRVWQTVFGVLYLFLILIYFSPNEQGYYYTILNILALQAFFELGLSVCLMNISSHEWTNLEFKNNMLVGNDFNAGRLSDLLKKTLIIMFFATSLYLLIIGFGGFYFISTDEANVEWVLPWVFSVIFTSLMIYFIPILSILEGTGNIESVSKLRFFEAFFSSSISALFIFFGFGLWAIAIQVFIRLICQIYFIFFIHKKFIQAILKSKNDNLINWTSEVFPLQSKLAVHAVVAYCSMSIIVPLIFYYFGSEKAGSFGMTMQIIGTIGALGIIWIQVCSPTMAKLVAQKKFDELLQYSKKITFSSLTIIFIVSFLVSFTLKIVDIYFFKISDRFVSYDLFNLLLLTLLCSQTIQIQSAYMRAFKLDKSLLLNIITSSIFVLSILYFSYLKIFNALIYSIVIFRIVYLIFLSFIIYKNNNKWKLI